jgi:hypothetical protein
VQGIILSSEAKHIKGHFLEFFKGASTFMTPILPAKKKFSPSLLESAVH